MITFVLVSPLNANFVISDTLGKNLCVDTQEKNILKMARVSLKLGDRDTPAPHVEWLLSKAICSSEEIEVEEWYLLLTLSKSKKPRNLLGLLGAVI